MALYRGESIAEEFTNSLTSKIKDLYEKHIFRKNVPLTMTADEKRAYNASNTCHICGLMIEDPTDKVRDHCHITGEYRGPAHNTCNTKYRLQCEVPVFFHNFSKYDSHLFITELTKMQSERNIQIIPSNTETYISVSKMVKLTRAIDESAAKRQRISRQRDKQVFLRIEFKDSYRFLGASVDALAKSLDPVTDFKMLHKFFHDDAKLLKSKGVFPSKLIKHEDDYERSEIPKREDFSTCLNDYEPISENEYKYAQSVYHHFGCTNLGEYSDLYLKTDVCILADIFEKF